MRGKATAFLLAGAAFLSVAASHAETPLPVARMAADCGRRASAVQPLAKILNTRDASFDCLGVNVDARADIIGVRFEKRAGGGDAPTDAPLLDVREFDPAEIASARGAVLDGTPGHDAVMLHGEIDPGRTILPLTVSFLYNGLTGEYRACTASLDRAADGTWHLTDARHRPISQITVTTWRLPLIGVVGIDKLRGLCSES